MSLPDHPVCGYWTRGMWRPCRNRVSEWGETCHLESHDEALCEVEIEEPGPARRRADRLEEAVREAISRVDPGHSAEYIIKPLRSALDSREDEGRTVWHCWICGWKGDCQDLGRTDDNIDPACPNCGHSGRQLQPPEDWSEQCRKSAGVHADEPDTRAEPGPPRCEADPDGYSRCDRKRGHDGPHRDYFGKEWPTDELEGDEVRQKVQAACDCDPGEELAALERLIDYYDGMRAWIEEHFGSVVDEIVLEDPYHEPDPKTLLPPTDEPVSREGDTDEWENEGLSREEVIARFCRLQANVAHKVVGYSVPNDCFCENPDEGGLKPGHAERGHFRSSGAALRWIEEAVERRLATHADARSEGKNNERQ